MRKRNKGHKQKKSPLVIICLIIAAAWAAFALRGSESQVEPIKEAIVSPIVNTASGNTAHNSLKVPVLMYHHVGPVLDPNVADSYVSSADFEDQVRYFRDLGYHTVKLSDVYLSLANGQSLPPKPLVFTFDDGYSDVFENAIPILQKYGCVGSFAIVTDFLGQPGYTTWDDVTEASRSGMEIVSHTKHHLDLISAKYSESELREELLGSRQVLESQLGVAVNVLIYPYGHQNEHIQQLAAEAGYTMAFTTDYGMNLTQADLLHEPRVRVHGIDGLEKLKLLFEPKHTVSGQTNP